MTNTIGRFYEPDVIGSCVSSLIDTPFWSEDSDGVIKKFEDVHRQIYFSQTLPSFGFYNMPDGNKLIPIQVSGNVARRITHRDLRDYVSYVLNRLPIGNRILDQMTMEWNKFFSENVLTSFRCVEKPFLTDTRTAAYRFYRNGAVLIHSKCDSVTLIPYDQLDALVWASDIIDRDFDASAFDGGFDEDSFLDDITDKGGHQFHKWCQNLCKSQDHAGAWTYNRNRFKALASGFGYLLHQRHNEHKCVIFVDEDLQQGSANGRTGKSVVLNDALSHLLPTIVIDAKQVKKGSGNQFTFNFVTEGTRYICLDDACEDFAFESLFSVITGDLTANKKYGGITKFSKNAKPKMSISTNHPILGDGASYKDRQHTVEIGGFYRFNKFELGRNPDSFHGGFLFDDEWSDENWSQFDLFAVRSLFYYLKNGLLNTGCSGNYHYNKLVASVGSTTLVNSITNFLQDNEGKEVYSKSVDGMSDDQKLRCFRDFVIASGSEEGETYSPNQASTALLLVADYLGFNKNVGMKDRNQKRFGSGKKAVDYYVFTKKSTPFPTKSEQSLDDVNPNEELFSHLDATRG